MFRSLRTLVCSAALMMIAASSAVAQGADVVLYAGGAKVAGRWSEVADPTAAGARRLENADRGMPKLSQASATPADFFELEFQGSAGVGYRLWMRGTAAGNSYANDSVFVQFSDSVTSGGSATYRIGTSGAVVYGIEDCSGCGVAGWGWNDNVYGAALGDRIYFKTTGVHTIRVQAREDGISIDQIVLSPVTYASKAPGALKNDTVILPAPGMPPAPAPAPDPAPAPAPTPAPAPAPTPAPTPDPAPAPTPSNLAPVFEAAPDGFRIAEFTQGSAPVTVYLSASATGPEATDALTYTWDFGDGSPVVTTRPSAEASRQNLPHTYTSAGTFTATVIVTDQAHNQSSQSGTVVVGAPAPFTGEQLKVMLWNTYKGRTTDTRTEGSKIWLFARWMAAARPDVVLLQEVMGRSAANKYKAALELETGVTWSYFFRTNAGTDSSTAEGVAIMTRLPILATASMPYTVCASARIPQRSAIAVTVPVNGRNVTIFDTHLSSYEGAAEIACRTKQGQELTTFAATFAEPRIIGGDLNADPLEPVMVNLLATYHDTWDLAMAAARAISYPDNPPETLVTKSERIDYVLSSKGAQVVDVLNVQVPDTRDYTNDNPVAAAGASNWAPHNAAPRVSDHETIIATFAVR